MTRAEILEDKFANRDVLPPLEESQPQVSTVTLTPEQYRESLLAKLKITPTAKLLQMKNAMSMPAWCYQRKQVDEDGLLTIEDIKSELATRPHVVHGPEGKVLRRLKSQTGMTEEEIRKVPDFVRQLKEAKGS